MKRILAALLCILMLLTVLPLLVACDMNAEDAQEMVEDFCEAIAEYDYKEAERLLHRDHKRTLANDLSALEATYEMQLNAAFLHIEDQIPKRTQHGENAYNTTYLVTYDFPFDAGKYGDRIEITATALQDDRDTGISNFTIRIYFAD